MIVVKVELHSAITGQISELARMHICNIGGTATKGDYHSAALRGRSKADLDRRIPQRSGFVRKTLASLSTFGTWSRVRSLRWDMPGKNCRFRSRTWRTRRELP